MFSSSTYRLIKSDEEDKSKLVLAAIETKLPHLHRLVTCPSVCATCMLNYFIRVS